MPKSTCEVSVIVPTLIRSESDYKFLVRNLDSIAQQSIHPREVIISVEDDDFSWSSVLRAIYLYPLLNIQIRRNLGESGISNNSNNGIEHASSLYLHVLHQDDALLDSKTYERVSEKLNSFPRFFLLNSTSLKQPPYFNETCFVGNNQIGGPSSFIFPRDPSVFFDPNLIMLLDVDFFYRLMNEFGRPEICDQTFIEYGSSDTQAHKHVKRMEFLREVKYLINKHEIEFSEILKAAFREKSFATRKSVITTLLFSYLPW